MKRLFLVLAISATFPIAALAQPAKIGSTPSGDVLQAQDGRTLYVYDGDRTDLGQQGRSSCYGECEKRWPPLPTGADAKPIGDWSTITREDDSKQRTYKGRPLYTWTKDTTPGQTSGNGFNGNNWRPAKP
jgi:predicted lipoprotein with Yx(FWY)xxD motif